MNEKKLEKFYKAIRIVIYALPAFIVISGLFLVLFPVEKYKFLPDNSKNSSFEIEKNIESNTLSFGIFPTRTYRYIELKLNLEDDNVSQCQNSYVEVSLSRTYKAFLYPVANSIENADQLRNILFTGNKTKYPNGSLLHLKPTNQVFFISQGKKILFPGPEIFNAFGFSFDDLVDVDQSDIDQFPDADQKVFLWTMAHPSGTVFQAFPSQLLYLIFEGRRYLITDKEMLSSIWPQNYAIPVSDYKPENSAKCLSSNLSGLIYCNFDSYQTSETGRYYFFSAAFPKNCSIEKIYPGNSSISLYSERSMSTIKDSLKNIASSVINRYFYKQ